MKREDIDFSQSAAGKLLFENKKGNIYKISFVSSFHQKSHVGLNNTKYFHYLLCFNRIYKIFSKEFNESETEK
jgi:hypothetical protein